jgi:protein kinase C substrate 80K-H
MARHPPRHLCVLLVLLRACAGAPPPAAVRGAPPHLRRLYRRKTWRCDGGATRVARERVNDDYCDCADGSDERGTSACSHLINLHNLHHLQEDLHGTARKAATAAAAGVGGFFCADARVAVRLPPSRVNDGVADCCDASDEWLFLEAAEDRTATAAAAAHENTCDDLLAARRAELLARAKRHEAGVAAHQRRHGGASLREAREGFAAYKRANADHWGRELQELQAKLGQVQKYLQQVMPPEQQQQQAAGGGGGGGRRLDPRGLPPDTMRALQFYQHVKQQVASARYQYALVEKVTESTLGARLEFFPLLVPDSRGSAAAGSAAAAASAAADPRSAEAEQMAPPCFRSDAINEKQLKGGTPNVIPQRYRFTFCPFRHVTQVEINHTQWEMHEKRAKQGLPLDAVSVAEEQSTDDDDDDDHDAEGDGSEDMTEVAVGADGGVREGAAGAPAAEPSIMARVIGGVLAMFGGSNGRGRGGGRGDGGRGDGGRGGPDSAKASASPGVDEETSETLVGMFSGWEEDLMLQEAYRVGAGLPSRIPSSEAVTREEAESAYAAAVASMSEDAKSAGVAAANAKSAWLSTQEDFRPRSVMVFRDGHECAEGIGGVGKVSRSMRVRFECGAEDAVLGVHEEGYCTYELRFATPSACSLRASREARETLSALPKPKKRSSGRQRKKKRSGGGREFD